MTPGSAKPARPDEGRRELGVGLIGCGDIAHLHTSALRDVAADGVPLRPVVAADPSESARRAVARNFRFPRLVDDWREVVADPEVDVVWACTPTHTHAELYRGVLEAGKHLYAEKPLGRDLAEVEALAAVADASPGSMQVGFQKRFHPVLHLVRSMLAAGELGEPMTYVWREDQVFPAAGIDTGRSAWRSEREHAGGGVLLEHGVHALDLLGWTFGAPTSVSARVRHVIGFDVEDTAVVRLDHPGGVSGTLTSVYGGVLGREQSRLEVHGRDAVVEVEWGVLVDDPVASVRVTRAGAPTEDIPMRDVLARWLADIGWDRQPFFLNEPATRAFAEALLEGRPPSPGIADGVAAHRLVDAAYRSAADGGALVSLA